MILSVDCSRTRKTANVSKGIMAVVACTLYFCQGCGPPYYVSMRPHYMKECHAGALCWFEEAYCDTLGYYLVNQKFKHGTQVHFNTTQAIQRLRDNERFISTIISEIEDHLINGNNDVPSLVFENVAFQDFVFIYFKSGPNTELLRECLHSISDPNQKIVTGCQELSILSGKTKQNKRNKRQEKNNRNRRQEHGVLEEVTSFIEPIQTKDARMKSESQESLKEIHQQILKLPSNIEEVEEMIAQYKKYVKCEEGDHCTSNGCLHSLRAIKSVDQNLLLKWYECMQRNRDFIDDLQKFATETVAEDSPEASASKDLIINTEARGSTECHIYEDIMTSDNADKDSTACYIEDDIMIDTAAGDSHLSPTDEIIMLNKLIGVSDGTRKFRDFISSRDSHGPSRSHNFQMGTENLRERSKSETQESLETIAEALQRIVELSSTNDELDKMIAKCVKNKICTERKEWEKGWRCTSADCLHGQSRRSVVESLIMEWDRHTQRMRVFIAEILYICCARTPMPQHWKLRFAEIGPVRQDPSRMGFGERTSLWWHRHFTVPFNRYSLWNYRNLFPKWSKAKKKA
eukprot:Gregarina_sp_Poly_1__3428@NODE_1998_length_2895_cov_24_287129_g1289_i0_p1_GENE_NODE_1998_length_2895_cov_24_287129_g1289_i0NODE_1998_length_2895_cov_24_287129_g1289_i0_p1_ORF_typecomplete_len574_score49_52RP854/PF17460_2/0_0097DUF3375/PF11855_8/2_4DUF3375/PF11855_8/47DUF4407/PF14362_6/0_38DUF4407/PF14362_6/6_7e02TRAUB/PF08164_12/0_42TRAUB/PF08164_12/3_5e03BLOC1_2/PF10046_9/18BLOC1_2/PF10046_9/16CENPR/PF06729_12/0_89CENPR/PF06729_12/2_1e02GIT1_C/PF12205_8/10GIT1_C/PF12205_8/1_3e03GIT1_C/PF12205_8